jgi:hypothetical protein
MMTVARRNRRWTFELVAKLRREIDTLISRGWKSGAAMEEVSPTWGISPLSIRSVYYGTSNFYKRGDIPRRSPEKLASGLRRGRPSKVMACVVRKSAPVGVAQKENHTDLSDAIATVKRFGGTITF